MRDSKYYVALEQSQKYGSNLLILSVYKGSMGAGTLVSTAHEDALRSSGQQIPASYEKKIQKINFPSPRLLMQKGDAAQRIIETAGQEKCGLVVLGSRGRGGFSELLLGLHPDWR